MKSELHVYSFDELMKDGSTYWDGVRNYQARNFMRDKMKIGDLVLYYHSNTKPPHIAGIARFVRNLIQTLLSLIRSQSIMTLKPRKRFLDGSL